MYPIYKSFLKSGTNVEIVSETLGTMQPMHARRGTLQPLGIAGGIACYRLVPSDEDLYVAVFNYPVRCPVGAGAALVFMSDDGDNGWINIVTCRMGGIVQQLHPSSFIMLDKDLAFKDCAPSFLLETGLMESEGELPAIQSPMFSDKFLKSRK